MKSRTSLYTLLVLALTILGVLWFSPALARREALPVFPATIHHDCAPADGSAFTVSIPIAKSVIGISIYQSPEIRLPATFTFPDDTEQIGNALLILPASWPEPLSGKVSFQRVESGMPVEGEFHLTTEMGEQYNGKFIAQWNRQPVGCG